MAPDSTTQPVLTTPLPGTKVSPIHRYSLEQHAQIDALRERRRLDLPDTLPRYLRPAKWQLDDAKKRIKSTIEWRWSYQPDLIAPEEVRLESETGKLILNGFDNEGRAILYVQPGRENTHTSPRQIRHLVWCLERARDLMPPGQESLVIIVDYKSIRTNPSIVVARKVVNILQRHYPETLGQAIVVNLPPLLNIFYKSISPQGMWFVYHHRCDLLYEFEKDSYYWEQIVRACGIAEYGTRIRDSDEKPER
ncbi:CRAL-TRIO domain-containing protein [Mycena olivaceomarginata]|nr:CRAL-TRIO domain-containing protein [Mycena olivaceomarginata]